MSSKDLEMLRLVILMVSLHIVVPELSKRLVLHDDLDIVTELMNLKRQVGDQNIQLQNLKSQMKLKDAEVGDQNSRLQNLTAQTKLKDAEVADQSIQLQNLTAQMKLKDAEVADQNSRLQNLTSQMKLKDEEIRQIKQTGGPVSTYTRWGRTTCPNGSSLVYSGYMAGTHYNNNAGNGANYLCLADVPTWDHYSGKDDNGIKITGVEYEFNPHHSTSALAQFLGTNVHNDEAPCAVCHVPRETSIMVPGRNQCYPGWTEEYRGYLVGGYPGFADSSEYVCLDRRPESVVGSGNSDNKCQLFFVEAHCGEGLECPPYIADRELTCAVCSM